MDVSVFQSIHHLQLTMYSLLKCMHASVDHIHISFNMVQFLLCAWLEVCNGPIPNRRQPLTKTRPNKDMA